MRIAIIATLVLSTWSLVGIASADAPRKPNGDAARRDRDGIKSPATADAWFKQYPAMSASADCGWNIAFEIDWASFKDTPPHHVISDGWCEQLTRIVSDVCAEPHGKSVMKPITVVRCEKLEGKASGPNSTMFHADGTKHAFQLAAGKLTIKFGSQIGTGFFHTGVIEAVFPSVRWHKEVDMNLPYVQKKLTDWTEDKSGVDLKLEIDEVAFAAVGWPPFWYTCGGDGNTGRPYPADGDVEKFLEVLYKTTDKGKKLLQKVKRVSCSVTTNAQGKTPEIIGDRLVYYARMYKGDKLTTTARMLDGRLQLPSNDPYYSYALLRKQQKLGGECPWNRSVMDKDPEDIRMCGGKK